MGALRHGSILLLAIAAAAACSSSAERPPPGKGSGSGKGGSGATGGKGGSSSGGLGGTAAASGGSGGESGANDAGAAGEAGLGAGGSESSGGSGGRGGAGASSGDGGGGKAAGGGAGGSDGGSGGTQSGSSGDSGSGGLPERMDCPSDTSPGSPPSTFGVCEPGRTLGAAMSAGAGSSDADSLIAITPDELSILWVAAGSSTGVAYVADCSTSDDAFGTAVRLGDPNVVGLSADGLRLLSRGDDGLFYESLRGARSGVFGTPGEGAFSAIDADAVSNDLLLGSAVLSADDLTLFYTAAPAGGSDHPLRVSVRSDTEPFPPGSEVATCEFQAFDGLGVRPTGISSDGLTLFYWDAWRSTARAAYRQTTSDPFDWFETLGGVFAVQPNTACDRLYFAGMGLSYSEPQ